MANTYTAISTITVGSSGSSSMLFDSIPANFRDLCLVFSLREDTDDRSMKITFNNDSSTVYSEKTIFGSAGTVYNSTGSSQSYLSPNTASAPSPAVANSFGNGCLYIASYSNPSHSKTVVIDTITENNAAGNAGNSRYVGTWANNSAISRITIMAWASKFVEYSTATLYGIK